MKKMTAIIIMLFGAHALAQNQAGSEAIATGKIIDKKTGDVIQADCLKYKNSENLNSENKVCTVFQFVKLQSGREDLKVMLTDPIDVDMFAKTLIDAGNTHAKNDYSIRDHIFSVTNWAYVGDTDIGWYTGLFSVPAVTISIAMIVSGTVVGGSVILAALFFPLTADLVKAPVVLAIKPTLNVYDAVVDKQYHKAMRKFSEYESVRLSHKKFLKIEESLRNTL